MVLLTATPGILTAVSKLSQSPLQFSPLQKTRNDDPAAEPLLSSLPKCLEEPVSHSSLVNLSQALLNVYPISGSEYTLNNLLKGTRVHFPPPPSTPEPSEEYRALKARLLKEQEQREYNRLLQKTNQGEPGDHSEDDLSPSLVLNILLSVLLCGFAGFWATRYWSNQGLRVLSSMTAGLFVGVAEVAVYAAYLRKARDARAKEVRKKESKVLIREELEENSSISEQDGIKTDIIWGRGMNGGVRRRIREQWVRKQDSGT